MKISPCGAPDTADAPPSPSASKTSGTYFIQVRADQVSTVLHALYEAYTREHDACWSYRRRMGFRDHGKVNSPILDHLAPILDQLEQCDT